MRLSPQEMQEQLANNGYHASWRLAVTAALFAHTDARQKGVNALLLNGPAGSGKTFFARTFAKVIGAQDYFMQFDRTTSREDLVYTEDIPGIIRATATREIQDGDIWEENLLQARIIPIAMEMSSKVPVVVILDEFEKSRPDVDAYMLDILQSGEVTINMHNRESGEKRHTIRANPENMFFILTKNDERNLSEPLMRRLERITLPYPAHDIELRIVLEAVDEIPKDVANYLITLSNKLRAKKVLKAPSTQEIINCCVKILSLCKIGLNKNAGAFGHVVYRSLVAYDEDLSHMQAIEKEDNIRDAIARIMFREEMQRGEMDITFDEAVTANTQNWEAK